MLAALILDFDGLILDTETPLLDSWERVHADHGFVYDREKGHNIIGHSDVYYDPWEAFPADHDRAQLEAEFERVKESIVRQQPILPGITNLIDAADHASLNLGIASNSNHDHVEGHLYRLGLHGRFATFACRDDVTHPKPAPDVYQLACSQLGIAPGAALAFEDSVPGHLAAHRAGLPVVVVPNPSTRQYEFEHARKRLESMEEFDLEAFISSAS
ncbi:MAG: HAD family hydrolase [Synoicihabitans sp.]